jgi:host factor-I protein
MSERINAQDAFLNYVRRNRIPVTVFLLNGVKLNGLVSCFDYAAIVLKREGYTQLVYKHAISTFSPHSPVNLFDSNGNGSGGYQQHGYPQQEMDASSTPIADEDMVDEGEIEISDDDDDECMRF